MDGIHVLLLLASAVPSLPLYYFSQVGFATLVLQPQVDETLLKHGIHACLAVSSLPSADFANWQLAQVLTAHWADTG